MASVLRPRTRYQGSVQVPSFNLKSGGNMGEPNLSIVSNELKVAGAEELGPC